MAFPALASDFGVADIWNMNTDPPFAIPEAASLAKSPGRPRLLLLSGQQGTVLVVYGLADGPADMWWFQGQPPVATRVRSLTWGGECVTAAAGALGDASIIGTNRRLLLIRKGVAERFPPFATLGASTYIGLGETLSMPTRLMTADGDGNVWLTAGFDVPRGFVFSVRPEKWRKASGSETPLPVASRWDLPCDALAGDPSGARTWLYSIAGEKGHLQLLETSAIGASAQNWMLPPSPRVNLDAPALTQATLVASSDGHAWLAGNSGSTGMVLECDGRQVLDRTPPSALLAGGGVTTIAVAGPDILLGTRQDGLLVRREGGWLQHPANQFVPSIVTTINKRIDALLPRGQDELWIGSGGNLIRWRAR
jgi:hypothetical protein